MQKLTGQLKFAKKRPNYACLNCNFSVSVNLCLLQPHILVFDLQKWNQIWSPAVVAQGLRVWRDKGVKEWLFVVMLHDSMNQSSHYSLTALINKAFPFLVFPQYSV